MSNRLPFPSSLEEVEASLEAEHYAQIQLAFKSYSKYHLYRLVKYYSDYDKLPQEHKDMLSGYLTRLNRVQECIKRNQLVFDMLLDVEDETNVPLRDADAKMESIRSLLRQTVRDWAREGGEERRVYEIVLEELGDRIKDTSSRILIPGAGLGRLAYEVAKAGYETEGCEFSLFMLLMSQLILNGNKSFDVYPYLFPFSNLRQASDHLQSIRIPEEAPFLPETARFNMLAGDFMDIYKNQVMEWDCVVTCFFIDTATNVLDYIQQIHRLLKPGGLWINVGPLLWHWDGTPSELSIELTLEEVKGVVCDVGFEVLREEEVKASYAQHTASMHQTYYHCSFMTLQKPCNNNDDLLRTT